MLARDVEDLWQRIDCPGVGRPDVGHDHERPQAAGTVLADRRGERRRLQAVAGIGRQDAQAGTRKAREARGFRDAVVRLFGEIEDAVLERLAEPLVACRDHGREAGERATRRQDAARPARKAHEPAQPRERGLLDLGEGGRRLRDTHVAVDGAGHEVGERRGVDAAAGNVGQVSGAGGVVAFRDRGPQPLEQRPERSRLLGRAFDEGRPQRLSAFEVEGGRLREAAELRQHEVGDHPGLGFELFRAGLERPGCRHRAFRERRGP